SPGWSGQYEWGEPLPFDQLPSVFNPPDGLWANANHNAARNSPHFFAREFIDPARYRRIRQVLESKQRHSAVDFGALQADEGSLPALRVAALLVEHLTPAWRADRRALEVLRGWDGRVSADSTAACIYEVFRNELVRARFAEALGDLVQAPLGVGPHPLLAAVNSNYFLQTARVQAYLEEHGADEAARRAFTSTVRWLTRRLGPDIGGLPWGRGLPFPRGRALVLPL